MNLVGRPPIRRVPISFATNFKVVIPGFDRAVANPESVARIRRKRLSDVQNVSCEPMHAL